MSSVVQIKKLGNTKHTGLGKTKSSCSSVSISSSDGRSNSMEASERGQRDSTAKQLQGKVGNGKNYDKQQTPVETSLDDFFAWVDPLPTKPPSYNSANPNKRVVFPIYDSPSSVHLPPYTPAVEEVTLVSMKMEWVNPFNMSPSRGWKNFIMEINSTQLNFYHIDPQLTKGIRNYCNGKATFAGESIDPILEYDSHHSIFNSFSSKNTYQFNKADQESLTNRIKKDKARYLANSKLFRTYSLQFAKFGIPTDYSRKTFVLRLRCETEQFLLSFSHVDDMIMWAMNLSMGIGVSLDIDFRELPTYRTVPRRRRRRRRKRNDGITNGSDGLRRITANRRTNSMPPSNSSASHRNGVSESHSSHKKTGSVSAASTKSKRGQEVYLSSSLSTAGSRRGSNDSIKSKLKSFFNADKKVASPTYKTSYVRTMSSTGLNSVVEDEEEDPIPMVTSSAANTPNKVASFVRPRLDQRSQSMELMNGNAETEDYFGFLNNSAYKTNEGPAATPGSPGSVGSIGGATIASGELQVQSGFGSNIGLQNDLAELYQIMREHNEDDEAIEEEEDEEDGDALPTFAPSDHDDEIEEEDDDDVDSVHRNPATTTSSIYQEEGIFHDSEDDYLYVVDRGDAFRRRASSVTSNLSSTPYGSEGVKWHPPRKEMSRRRYIRDSLRCIKPLPSDEEWIGKVMIRAIPSPAYETNNPPVSGFIFDQGKTGKRKAPKIKSLRIENGIILNKCKNHFVKPYVVGPTGLLKTNARC
ncbi:LAME_0H06260g1_1 [Lachancea meyersii CBS 8951]|uniref:LAME_0H06260g1_1 n=1 Tax=Lachancea meyersii CBS 8951 TaxID=1266667 RepID=A0A1G4KEM8_9SACH|nr:LAME_0H06260g1_1 [Lachancea meyersii CBS 8951]